MKIIGITGGVGAGKSTVLDHLEKQYNACVLQADKQSEWSTQCLAKPARQREFQFFYRHPYEHYFWKDSSRSPVLTRSPAAT